MNERAELIKTAIMLELAKEGKTLQDLETSLAMDKTAGNLWQIPGIGDVVKGIQAAGTLGISSALAGGALAGTGLYAAHLANEDSTNQQVKRMKEKQQYDEARRALIEKMQYPTTM